MSLAIEVVTFPPSEAYRKDAALITPVAQYLKENSEALGAYHGIQLEDPNNAYLFVVWESVEKHKELINNAEIYPKLGAALALCVEGGLSKLSMFHVAATGTAAAALNAPVTAVTHISKLKEGTNPQDLTQALNSIITSTSPSGAHGGFFGPIVERSGEYALTSGWDSVEQHIGAIGSDPAIKKAIETSAAYIVERTLGHVRLTPYFKYQG